MGRMPSSRRTARRALMPRSAMRRIRGSAHRRRTILIPLDGSPLSERVLHHLDHVLPSPPADLVLLQVVGPSHAGMLVRGDDAAAYSSMLDQRDHARRYLKRVQRRLARRDVRSRLLVRTGDTATEIVKAAREERVDLILMSTHGRSGIRRALMGSVAESVLRSAPVPSLLIPAKARVR